MAGNRTSETREPLVHLSKRPSIAAWRAWLIRLIALVLGLAVCGAVAFILIDKLRENPGKIGDFFYAFIKGSFGTPRKLWKMLKNLSILLCIALALTPAFRMRFWNIGAEGQTLMGVLGAITVDFYLGGKIPEGVLLVLMLLAAVYVFAFPKYVISDVTISRRVTDGSRSELSVSGKQQSDFRLSLLLRLPVTSDLRTGTRENG